MKHERFLVVLVSMVIGSANPLHAQKPVPKFGPLISAPDLSKLSIGKTLEQVQAMIEGNGEAPLPIQIVVQFLQLRPGEPSSRIPGLQICAYFTAV